MKIYATAADDYTDISAATAATAKRGRPFGSKNKNVKAVTRKAKTEANSVIKQLYSSPRKGSSERSPKRASSRLIGFSSFERQDALVDKSCQAKSLA